MPHLATLRREGAWCPITTPPGLGDDAVWGSFSTGVSPGEHGRFFYTAIETGTYGVRYKDASWLKREPFWSALARRGRRVAVVDVPKSDLSREASVVQLVDWRSHGRSGLTAANPPELAAEVIARFGDDLTDVYEGSDRRCFKRSLDGGDVDAFLAELEVSTERKLAASEWLLDRGAWDLFLVVFKEAHCAGHLCWNSRDPDQGALRRIYGALDAALGRLLSRVHPDTPVIVFSDLGMDDNFTGEHLLDAVLVKLEAHVVPRRGAIRRALSAMRGTRRNGTRTIDARALARAARSFFAVEHNEISGAVRFNLEGREPSGLLRRGRELDEIRARLMAELMQLTDPEHGHRIVESIVRSDQAYAGTQIDDLPDLLVVWRRDAPISGAASATIGEVRTAMPNFRPGNHVAGGILFARAPDIARGVELAAAADIADLAPTLAARVGVRLENVDGRPIDGVSPREFAVGRARP